MFKAILKFNHHLSHLHGNQSNLNPKIKIKNCCPHTFSIVVGEVVKISSKFILCDYVLTSHDLCILLIKIDITRRNFTFNKRVISNLSQKTNATDSNK